MMTIRRAEDRGHMDHGWLDARHSFSFGHYMDPEHMGFRALRVINEDRVQPGQGFGTHPHDNMEIVTWVLEGALEHRDSMGNGSVIRPGEIQRMTAGTGITHSEFNPSTEEGTHLLQIWLLPEERGLEPTWEQRRFEDHELAERLRLVASGDGADDAVHIRQDARLYVGRFGAGDTDRLALAPGRHAWVQVARGSVALNGEALGAGDGAALSDVDALQLEGIDDAEVLVFDLA